MLLQGNGSEYGSQDITATMTGGAEITRDSKKPKITKHPNKKI